jgi:hypothetical protein
MENENILELEEQIKELEDRVYVLEKHEATRKVKSSVKLLIKVILIIGFILGLFYAYNYVVNELPKIIEREVKEAGENTINKIEDTIKGNN